MTVLTDLNDSDVEVRREKRPSGSPAVALLETAHGEHGLLAVSPAHARAFQPLGASVLHAASTLPLPMGSPGV